VVASGDACHWPDKATSKSNGLVEWRRVRNGATLKIAVFFPDAPRTGWSSAWGIPRTLKRMGHEVISGGIPVDIGNPNAQQLQKLQPTLEQLKQQDLILVSGTEHIAPWLDALYQRYEWKQLPAVKANWYHESFFREDFTIDFETVSQFADEHFFPGVQDAEHFDQESFAKDRAHWLPFGVDTQVFRKLDVQTSYDDDIEIGKYGEIKKRWPVAFIGWIYEKRGRFLKALSQHDIPPIRAGSVDIRDLGGYQAEESTRRMADNIRHVGVFFNMPALSQLLVSKVYEVMACGTFLLTPLLSQDRGISNNTKLFESGRHLVYYRSSNLPYVAQLLREWSSAGKEEEREKIAATGCQEVHANHSLEKRLEVILEKCGVREPVH
jgi:Glycosyl transferases group 1